MFSPNAVKLITSRYKHASESVEGVFKRVAKAVAIKDEKFEKELYDLMTTGIFLPNSPAIRNAGKKKGTLSACFVLPIEDSIGGIYQTLTNMALVFQRGGGVGIDFTPLRPEGFPLSSGGTSSGPVSFMKIFDINTEVIKAGGFRRGASLLGMQCSHVDIERFCQAKLKGQLSNANLSVIVTDKFMKKAAHSGKSGIWDLIYDNKVCSSVQASNILDLIAYGSWCVGDPGVLFYDRINKDNKKFPTIPITCTNPCGEVPLPPYAACNLGSINIDKFVENNNFNFDRFAEAVRLGSRALAHINIINWYPIEAIRRTMEEIQAQGLGIMGFADALIRLGIYYDSEECLDFIDKLGKIYVEQSNEIAPNAFYKRSIAPTGSLSILADCSSGIEPIFYRSYVRDLVAGTFAEGKDIYSSKYCKIAHEISPEWHIKVQARWQKYVDAGVSKSVNCSANTTVEDIRKFLILAWKSGCKGITIFRDKSKNGVYRPIQEKCEGEVCHL